LGRLLVRRIANPFVRGLDELQTAKENKANRTGTHLEDPVLPPGAGDAGRPYEDLRWSRFGDREPAEMFAIVSERVFPFLRGLGGDGSTYGHDMRDARFTIPTPALLTKVVDLLDALPIEGRDTKGDVDEYMLSKIASAGQNGQFRTPRRITELTVAGALCVTSAPRLHGTALSGLVCPVWTGGGNGDLAAPRCEAAVQRARAHDAR
jgi:hypothetical protein